MNCRPGPKVRDGPSPLPPVSIAAGGPDGVVHPSQPVASTSRPRYAVLTMRVIIVRLLSLCSTQWERDGELVRHHVNPTEGRRNRGRKEEAADDRPGVRENVAVARCYDQPIRPVRHAAAVAQVEIGMP